MTVQTRDAVALYGVPMHQRSIAAAIATLTVAAASAVAYGGTATVAKVKCPIKASSSSNPVEWAFTESGAPSGAHKGISSSYTHGRGTWQSGKASGTICHADQLRSGKGSQHLVLTMSGSSKLSPHVTRLGLLGVELGLKVKVAASDDSACPVGSLGTVTLFASYYSVHKDSVQLRFSSACADHNHSFTGSSLHVLITRKGAQVNSP
ncbi:MAG TPA: hypothetical protein VFW38_11115 [Solirubrobacteraceae bacterium]|nr:hypothetical protein [Solirubrobacteraceae bacterium]